MQILFEPIFINKMEIKNRLVISAMGTRYFDDNGIVTERYLDYIKERAKGGWGLIITEICRVNRAAGHVKGLPGLYNEEHVQSHKRITDCVHENGGKVAVQLYHGGWRAPASITGQTPLAPSAIPAGAKSEMPKEMSGADIKEIIGDFVKAAANAKKAGYDGVEIHCGHGYLLSTFLSPTSNKRVDEYGGSLLNRSRIVMEILKGIRAEVGPDYPVWCKLSVHEYLECGLEIADSIVLARLFEKAGANAIHCSQGTHLSNHATIPPSCTPKGKYLGNAAAIKQAVDIPVIAVGRLNDPYLAEMALERGMCDLIAMARASLADPYMPEKIRDGKEDEILNCIACLQGCIGEFAKGRFIRCLVNPRTGMECEFNLAPAEKPLRIYVGGGGIAGCEAAIAAARKGHKVTLFEKDSKLGGQWLTAAVPPGKQEFLTFTAWQKKMLDNLGVEIRLQTPLTSRTIQEEKPDAVFVATGSKAVVPPIKGADRDHVVLAADVLLGKARTGSNIVVIGGGLVGVETADFLSGLGKKVSIIEILPEIASEAEANSKYFLLRRLKNNHVEIFTSSKVMEIEKDSVRLDSNGRVLSIPADTVIMAAGMRSDNGLLETLSGASCKVVSIGDASSVKNGLANLQEAYAAGLNIKLDA